MIRHKSGQLNKGADALSRKYIILSTLGLRVLGFEFIKELYPKDEDFHKTSAMCLEHPHGLYHVDQGFLFKGDRLCIPKGGL